MDALCAQLEEAVGKLRDSDTYKHYLDVMSRFHQYSYRNTLLILEQFPDATLVASFSAWKKLGRSVKKGEHGIRILAPVTYPARRNVPAVDPATGLGQYARDGTALEEQRDVRVAGFRPVSVFDVSQTKGRELPALVNELEGDVDGYEHLYNAIIDASGVRVMHKPLEGKACGSCDTRLGIVTLREGLSQAQSIKTLIHEIAHYRMHPPGNQYPRALREVQAESMAYVVSAHFGLDTSDYSLGYVEGWASSASDPELKSSLDVISRHSSTLIKQVEHVLERQREKDKERPVMRVEPGDAR